MKRLFVLAVAAVLLLSLAACGSEKTETTDTDANAVTEAAENADSVTVADTAQDADVVNDADTDEDAGSAAVADGTGNTAEAQTAAQINIDKLKEIEENDNFEVRITKKEFVKDARSGMVLDGHDYLLVTVSNYTSGDISDVTFLVASYTETNELKRLGKGATFTYSNDPYVLAITSEEGSVIAPGQSQEIAFSCEIDDIVGARAIVASYTTTDGKVHENSQALEWYKNVQLGRTTVLD